MMKRLGIFAFYDTAGIVDQYVSYYLEQMSSILERIIIVSNSPVTEKGKMILHKYSEDIIIRKDIGFDAGAYKDVIVNYLGEHIYKKYDQIVLFNDTVYGPFYDMSKIFAEMGEIEGLDMWGITEQSTSGWCHEYMIPPHIQAYFLVFNKKLIMSRDFWEYWDQLQYPQNYDEAVIYFEGGISVFFRKRGYSLSVYCKPERLERKREIQAVNNTLLYCGELIVRYKCPFLKRKALIEKMGNNVNALVSMSYLTELGYDTTLIWGNLLRRYSILDILETMDLNYIIDNRLTINIREKTKKIAVIFVGENKDYIEKVIEKIEEMDNVNLFIVSSKKYKDSPKIHFVQCNKEKLFEAYFILCAEVWKVYDYVCCINDTQLEKDMLPLECDITSDWIWNNLIYSQGYISAVIQLFETEDSLGILLPYFPLEMEYNEGQILYFDEKTLNEINKYIQLFDLTLANEKNRTPLLGQRSFWCRTSIISNLLHRHGVKEFWTENELIVRDLIPYLFIAEGQFPAYLNNSIYAGKQNIQVLLTSISTENRRKAEENAFFEKIQHNSIYIYGAGKVADVLFQKCKMEGIEIKGFIVSDGEVICKNKYGIPIIYLSMVKLEKSDLVVIGVGKKIRPEIEKQLIEKKIKYI